MGITNPTTSKGHPAWVPANLGGSNGKSTAAARATSATTRVKGLIPYHQQKSADSNKNLIIRKQTSNGEGVKSPSIRIYDHE